MLTMASLLSKFECVIQSIIQSDVGLKQAMLLYGYVQTSNERFDNTEV